MDFDSHQSAGKPKETGDIGLDDHSPNDDFSPLQQKHHGMSSSDDFEHINDDYDLLGSSMVNAPAPVSAPSSGQQNLLDFSLPDANKDFGRDNDFDFNESPKLGTTQDNSPIASFGFDHKAATIDFMQAERNEAPPVVKSEPKFESAPSAAPTKPLPPTPEPTTTTTSSSILDEIEDDYLNPYAASKSQERFISSEDLLREPDLMKEPAEARNATPDFFEPAKQHFEEKVSAAPKPAASAPPATDFSPSVFKLEEPIKPAEVPKPIVVEPSKVEEIKPAKKPEPVSSKPKEQITAAEEIFCRIGLGKFSRLSLLFAFCEWAKDELTPNRSKCDVPKMKCGNRNVLWSESFRKCFALRRERNAFQQQHIQFACDDDGTVFVNSMRHA